MGLADFLHPLLTETAYRSVKADISPVITMLVVIVALLFIGGIWWWIDFETGKAYPHLKKKKNKKLAIGGSGKRILGNLRMGGKMLWTSLIFGSLPFLVLSEFVSPSQWAAKKVAVIGGGAGGASTAYHIGQYAAEAGIPVNITVFERNTYLGGRSTTVNAWGAPSIPIELGASIFVQVNKILVDTVQQFNLSTDGLLSAVFETKEEQVLGIWNGREFVLRQKTETGWWEIAKLLWRYGLAPIRTNNLMKAVVGKFLKMYDEPYFPWSSLTQVAYNLGLTAVTAATGEQYLAENNIGDAFANEVVQASTRVNYAQNLPLIHGLETMVCMAAQGAMSVDGGNWKIFDSMIRHVTSDVRLDTPVTGLERLENSTYLVSSGRDDAEVFDSVVLAAPFQFSGIKLPSTLRSIPDSIPYVTLHVTLFASPHKLSPEAFNLPSDVSVPQIVITTLPPDEHLGADPNGVGAAGFFSISTLRYARNPTSEPPGRLEYIYKVFSPGPANATFLSKILGVEAPAESEIDLDEGDVSWIHRKVWHSYPYEYPRVTFEELQLDSNLWYTSGIESFISTMETSALMGKNVAKLLVNGWEGEDGEELMHYKAGGHGAIQVPVPGDW